MDTLQICNAALAHNGMPRITNLDEESNSARFCKEFFPVCRDRVLRDHYWSFATRGADLSRLAETPFDSEYLYTYALPVDIIRIVRLDPDEEYRRVGKKIFANVTAAKLIYIAKIEDSSQFDALFCEALEYALAKEICMANSKDATGIQIFEKAYRERLATARSIDTVENVDSYPVRVKRESEWLKSR